MTSPLNEQAVARFFYSNLSSKNNNTNTNQNEDMYLYIWSRRAPTTANQSYNLWYFCSHWHQQNAFQISERGRCMKKCFAGYCYKILQGQQCVTARVTDVAPRPSYQVPDSFLVTTILLLVWESVKAVRVQKCNRETTESEALRFKLNDLQDRLVLPWQFHLTEDSFTSC